MRVFFKTEKKKLLYRRKTSTVNSDNSILKLFNKHGNFTHTVVYIFCKPRALRTFHTHSKTSSYPTVFLANTSSQLLLLCNMKICQKKTTVTPLLEKCKNLEK